VFEGELGVANLGGADPDAPRHVAVSVDAFYEDLHRTSEEFDAATIHVVARRTYRIPKHDGWKNDCKDDCATCAT